ncbi:MAG: cytochrome c [Bacteroidota bacterium]
MKNTTLSNRKNSAEIIFTVLLLLFVFFNIYTINAQPPKKWVSPAAAEQLKNPIPSDPNSLKEAKKLYISNCSPCHGNGGKGDGIASASVNPKPADHTSAAIQKESDGSLYWKLTEGRSPMPSYKQVLTDAQRWQLINFIRTLAKK